MTRFTHLLQKLRRDDEGSASTVEAALWLPVFVLFLALVIDVSLIYNQQSAILRIVQDANRAYAVGRFETEAEAEAYITTAIADYTTNTTVDTVYDGGVITTTLTIPATDLMALNKFSAFNTTNVIVSSQQLAEF